MLLDRNGKVSQNWVVTGMSKTFVVDRQGLVVGKIIGKRECDDEQHLRLPRELAGN